MNNHIEGILGHASNDFVTPSIRRLPEYAGAVVVLVSILALVGWTFNIAYFKQVLSGKVAMNPMTAVAFILSTISLWLSLPGRSESAYWPILRQAARACAAAVALIGIVRLTGYAAGIETGLDSMLFPSKLMENGGHGMPNRIAPNTAVNFILVGSTLFTAASGRRLLGRIAETAVIFVILISFTAFIGHAYDAHGLYRVPSYIGMALNTAACFMLIGIGILASRPDRGPMSVVASAHMGGTVARRLVLAAFLIPIVLGWISMLAERSGIYGSEFGLGIIVSIYVVFLVIVILRISHTLNLADGERKRVEGEVRRLNEELERRVLERTAQLESANGELEAFSYSVSHDLRAPLRSLSGFGEMLAKRIAGNIDEKSRHYLSVIIESAAQMGKLIDDLLAFSRAGRMEMKKGPVNMESIVREAIHNMETETSRRAIEWEIKPMPDVRGDQSMLKQVAVNLISNAVKFTRSRRPARIEIGRVSEMRESGIVNIIPNYRQQITNHDIFYVKDNGAGFDMEYADKLYGLFQRLHNQDEFEGTGVGLANVKRIIHRHGGQVWAESKVDEGATFYFTLPKEG